MTVRHNLIVLLALLGTAAGAQRLEDVPDLRFTAFIAGQCERLVLLGEDVSDACRHGLYTATYDSGRISFFFLGGEGDLNVMLSFSGTGQRREDDRTSLRLDRITLSNETEGGAASEAAEGVCEYSDLATPPARISCAGRTRTGDFAAIFTSIREPATRPIQ